VKFKEIKIENSEKAKGKKPFEMKKKV